MEVREISKNIVLFSCDEDIAISNVPAHVECGKRNPKYDNCYGVVFLYEDLIKRDMNVISILIKPHEKIKIPVYTTVFREIHDIRRGDYVVYIWFFKAEELSNGLKKKYEKNMDELLEDIVAKDKALLKVK